MPPIKRDNELRSLKLSEIDRNDIELNLESGGLHLDSLYTCLQMSLQAETTTYQHCRCD